MKKIIALLALLLPVFAAAPATGVVAAALKIDTAAEQVIIIDHTTKQVLFEKNADQLMHPSSMTKLMTTYVLFNLLKQKAITPDTLLNVSQNAWRMGGSKMFLALDSAVRVQDLLHGIIIQSGNDACVVAAEGTMGSEDVFAASMTQMAHELGAKNSNFKNASGWPDPEHLTTARDLSIILAHLIDDFPEYHSLFQMTEFTYNNIRQYNRNPLLNKNVNCDVGKTGFTDSGGYGLTASAVDGGTRIDMVINGLPNSKARATEALKLMTWALKTFGTYSIFQKGQLVDTAPVWLGSEDKVPLTVDRDCMMTLPKIAHKDLKVEIKYNSPIEAPFAKNTVVGSVVVSAPGMVPAEIPLITAVPVDKAGFFKRIRASIYYLIWGKAA
jgi:D-alanyl-D-alanine carboxypeptidase (penicillin-binding protein 5/6)